MTKISQYPEITLPDVADLLVGTDVENSNATKNFTIQSVIDLVPKKYKVYTALLTQSGTSAPVATVLENTLGGNLVWSRSVGGVYQVQLNGAFTISKTAVILTNGNESGTLSGEIGDLNNIVINSFNTSGVQVDGVINNATIEIRVYE